MELPTLNFPVVLSFLLFLYVLQKILWKKSLTSDLSVKLPPGPWKVPLIGHMHHLVGSLPHRALRNLAKKYGPLMHLQLGEVSAVVISSAELAREVLMVNDISFASKPNLLVAQILFYDSTDIVFSPHGEYWKQLKKICATEFLASKRVSSFWPIREEELTMLLRKIASKEGFPFNLTKEVFATMYAITSKAAFGQKCEDHENFMYVSREVVKAAEGFTVADLFPSATWLHYLTGERIKLMKLRRQADRIMDKIIDEHRIRKSNKAKDGDEAQVEDLIDILLKFLDVDEHQFHLTTENIKAVIMDVFTAASDTAATTIDWAMAEMMKNQRVLRKAQCEVREIFDKKGKVDETSIDEMHYLKLVIKETLRLHTPLPLLLPRECEKRSEIGGYDIPLGTKVMVNAWAISRDSTLWTDPENFYPERFMESSIDYKGAHFQYIPFGAGRRICPGIMYGITNVGTALALLLYHFDWKLPNGMKNEELVMTERHGVSVRRKDDLELVPTVYQAISL